MKKTLIIFCLFFSCMVYAQDQNDLALLQLGRQYENSGEIEQAEKIYAKLYEKNSNYYEFYDAYRKILEYSKKFTLANEVIQKWLQSRPGDLIQITNLGINLMREGNEDKGFSAIQDAIRIAPKNINVYRSVAASLAEARYYDDALKVYMQGRDIEPNAFILEIANIYIFREKYENAMQEYLKLLLSNNNQFGYVQSVMMSQIDNKKFLDAAVKVTKQTLEENKNNLSLCYLLSWLYNEQKNYKDAYYLYLEIEKKKQTNGFELYNFAENAFRDKSFEIASEAYKYIIDNYKNSGVYYAARFGYAKTVEELSNNNYSERSINLNQDGGVLQSEVIPLYSGAITLYENLLKEFPLGQYSTEAHYRIGQIKFRKYNDLDGAAIAFNDVIKKYYNQPFAVNSLLDLGEIAFLKNNIDEAAKKYSEVIRHPVAQPEQKDMAKFKISEFLYFKADFDSVIKTLTELSKNSSSDFTNDALLLMNFIQSNTNDKYLPEFAKAEMYERQKKLSESLALFKTIADGENHLLSDEALYRMGLLQKKLGSFFDALKSFASILNRFPESSMIDKILFLSGNIYEKDLKDNKNAILFYERLLVEYPNSMYINEVRKSLRDLKGDNNF